MKLKLSQSQMAIYEMDRYAGGSVAGISGALLLTEAADFDRLETAVDMLLRESDTLRVQITLQDGSPLQEYQPYTKVNIPRLCFDCIEQFETWAHSQAHEPIDVFGNLATFFMFSIAKKQCGIFAHLHHILGDAWTVGVIAEKFCACYYGEKKSIYPYTDYLDKETAYQSSEKYSKDKAYWLEVFNKNPEPAYLCDRQSKTHRAERFSTALTQKQTAAIRSYCAEHSMSEYGLFLSILATYHYRIIGKNQFYIGTPVLNRMGVQEKNTIGAFVNTVPLAVTIGDDETFETLCSDIGSATAGAFRHQRFLYSELLKVLRTEKKCDEALFDVVLSYQNIQMKRGAELRWYPCGMQIESLQIHVSDRNSTGVFHIDYDYQTEKFVQAEIEALHERLMVLIENVMAEENRKLHDIEILSQREKHVLLYDFNNTAAEYEQKCVHTLFEEQAAKTPSKTAVTACDKTLTYSELNREANKVANALIASGVQPNQIVPLILPRRSYLTAAMFGILKSGGAYLPIDPAYPVDRISYMLNDCDAKIIVTTEEYAEKICFSGNVLNIGEVLQRTDDTQPQVALSIDNLCYCIYTSGSTGKPKLSLLRHRGLVNFCSKNNKNILQSYMANCCKNILSLASIAFDLSIFETVLPLLHGINVVVANEVQINDSYKLSLVITENSVDCIFCTPTKIQLYCESESFIQSLALIKLFMIGAELFSPSLFQKLQSFSSALIFNAYGPTEATIGSAFYEVTNADITIGKPIANTQIYIVDKYLNLLPIGAVGELCIAGDGVGAGYLNRPELTAEKFVANPFGKGRLYKTGDLARWRADGNIEYIERNDFQVKIRGLRVELGEIENALCAYQTVKQAAVAVQTDDNGRQYICAFYVADDDIEPNSIRAFMGKSLPQYMLPHSFTRIDSLPQTTSGKLDRKALPEVSFEDIPREIIPCQTQTEMKLAALWAQVLPIKSIGKNTDFFEVGGDSLQAISLISKVANAFDVLLETKTIFEHPVLESLAQIIEKSAKVQCVQIPKAEYRPYYPLTPPQKRVYLASALENAKLAYNMPASVKLTGVFDAAKMRQALDQIVKLQKSFQTGFRVIDGEIVSFVDTHAELKIESYTDRFLRKFDLSKPPLVRIAMEKISDQLHRLHIDMHHIIADGASLQIFVKQLSELYNGNAIAPLQLDYSDYACYSSSQLQKNSHTKHKAKWKELLCGISPLDFPTDYKRPSVQSFEGKSIITTVPKEMVTQIAKQMKVTPFILFKAVLDVFLFRYTGAEDIVIGTAQSGREQEQLEDIVGMFVNTVVLRGKPDGEKTFEAYVQEVNQNFLAALEVADYPFELLVKDLEISNDNSRNPVFDIMLAYQNTGFPKLNLNGLLVETEIVDSGIAKFDLTFDIIPSNEEFILRLEYNTALFRHDTAQRMLENYVHLLHSASDDVSQSLQNLELISMVEKQKLLYDFNNVVVEYEKKCIHTLFEEQAEKVPETIAVTACDKSLTYSELNREANTVANMLLSFGVQPNQIVPLILPRRSYLIAAMLGILKSGGAYLLIDPTYPADRTQYLLDDSNSKIVISNAEYADTFHFYGKVLLIENLLKSDNDSQPEVLNCCNQLLCAIPTSGSTGVPKITALMHSNACNFIHATHYMFADIKNVISTTTVVFDAFIMETMLAICHGVNVVLLNEDTISNQIKFENEVEKYSNCFLFQTPTKLETFVKNSKTKKFLKHIETFVVGGEVFTTPLCKLVTGSHSQIYNIYGPTETTICVSVDKILNCNDITIGKPIANTQIYIVDKYLNLLPIGAVGELCIAGDGVGAGYLNRPELTAEKFVANPFGKGRLYKTGDLARWRADGNIEYIGRNDLQVKIRGLRVELGEIENALCAYQPVQQAAVVMQKDENGRQMLCAFYTSAQEIPSAYLREELAKMLPRYMVPHIFTRLESFPMTTSGKTDRKAFPQADVAKLVLEHEYIEPITPIQKQMAALMETVLNTAPIGTTDDFFELGGDSLKAIELTSKAHAQGVYFNLQAVFDNPTVQQLCAYIENGDVNHNTYCKEDFAKYQSILAGNEIDPTFIPKKAPVGDLLLTGATGFLGAHVLAEYLEKEQGKVYCLVRGNDTAHSEDRFCDVLHFYFGDRYDALLGKRIFVICADIATDQLTEMSLPPVDMVIHTAASVKHYGSYQYFYDINVCGTKNVIRFAQSKQAKLIHISTLSVSGNSMADQFDGFHSEEHKDFSERDLYIEQPLDNVYIRSKFEAEAAVLDAMVEGLQANIIRVGNLTNRFANLKFQKNYAENAFLNRVKAVIEFGALPDYLMSLYVEFSPVDKTAQSIMTIAKHFNMRHTVFHANSNKVVYFDRMIAMLRELSISLRVLTAAEFADALSQTAKAAQTKSIYEALINDMDEDNRLVYDSNISIHNEYTLWYLKNLGFIWPDITLEYIKSYIQYFKDLGYFLA